MPHSHFVESSYGQEISALLATLATIYAHSRRLLSMARRSWRTLGDNHRKPNRRTNILLGGQIYLRAHDKAKE